MLAGLWGKEGPEAGDLPKEGMEQAYPSSPACLPGMFHWHLEHKVGRDFKELRVTAIRLQHQRHHIEAAVLGLPTKVDAQLGARRAQMSPLAQMRPLDPSGSPLSATKARPHTWVNSTLAGSPRMVPSGIW